MGFDMGTALSWAVHGRIMSVGFSGINYYTLRAASMFITPGLLACHLLACRGAHEHLEFFEVHLGIG